MQLPLERLELEVQMNLSFQEITDSSLDGVGSKYALSLVILVDVGARLPLRRLCPQNEVITRQYHLEKLCVVESAIFVNVEVLYHQLAVLL